jgi:hypothetical protein
MIEAHRYDKVPARARYPSRPSDEMQFYPAEGQHSGTPTFRFTRLTNSTSDPPHVAIVWAVSFDPTKLGFCSVS